MSDINKQLDDLWAYLTDLDLWLKIGTAIVKILIIILVAIIIVKVSKRIINRIFSSDQEMRPTSLRMTERRENTLKKLTANVVAYVVYFIAFMMILDNVLDLDVKALLASAGVVGIAIGFGAQNLVRDIIAGFFIIFEDQFSVGDYVLVSGVEGTVEVIGLRTTKILSWTGEMNILPNGDITHVTNYSVSNGLAIVDINIPYESDIKVAEKIIEDVAATLPEKDEAFVSAPVVHGVQSLELSHFVIRVIAETQPSLQWYGERLIRKEMKEGLYSQGIEIPSPRLVMYSRNKGTSVLNANQVRENES